MSDQRVGDELVAEILSGPISQVKIFKSEFVLDLLLDLKDARDQLKTYQEMRSLYNKEPEE